MRKKKTQTPWPFSRSWLWVSVGDVYQTTTPPCYQPRPFHHVRAGLPLPEIGYEEDESLLNAVWKKTDHLLEVKTFNYFVKTKSAPERQTDVAAR